MLNNNISDIFLTNTNIEQPSHHPLKIKADHKNPLNHLVTFEANASKSYLIVDKDNIFSDEYKFKPRSLNNDYLSNPQKKSFSRKKYEKLRKNLSFLKQDENDQKYNYGYFGIMPLLFFFKYLASTKILKETQDCLKLNLPDTIIINEEDFSPIWLYTSQTGFVHKTENFLMKDIFERLGLVENADELVAVLKRPHFENQLLMGNDSKLFSTKDLNEWCNESLLGRRGGKFLF